MGDALEEQEPSIVTKAKEVQKRFLWRIVFPFILYALFGGVVGLPFAIEFFDPTLGDAGVLGLVALFCVGLAIGMVPLIKNAKETEWAKQVLNQWEATKIKKQLTGAGIGVEEEDPVLASMETMVSRIEALLEPTAKARNAVQAAERRTRQLVEERKNILTTLEGLQGTGEGKAALEAAAAQLNTTARRLIDELATVYAALAARQAAEPAVMASGLKGALERLQAEDEVAKTLLPQQPIESGLPREEPKSKSSARRGLEGMAREQS